MRITLVNFDSETLEGYTDSVIWSPRLRTTDDNVKIIQISGYWTS